LSRNRFLKGKSTICPRARLAPRRERRSNSCHRSAHGFTSMPAANRCRVDLPMNFAATSNGRMKRYGDSPVGLFDAWSGKFDEPVDLLFIDGLSRIEGVKIDFRRLVSESHRAWALAVSRFSAGPRVLKGVSEDVFKSGASASALRQIPVTV